MASDERIIHEIAVMYARALKRHVAEFESEMNKVSAVQNMTAEEFDRLVSDWITRWL